MLMEAVRMFDGAPVLAAALRSGRLLVEAFVRHAMPLLSKAFPTQRDDVLGVLGTLQKSTRLLQAPPPLVLAVVWC
jgi:hypothetical protein